MFAVITYCLCSALPHYLSFVSSSSFEQSMVSLTFNTRLYSVINVVLAVVNNELQISIHRRKNN